MTYDVFICHASVDKQAYVSKLATVLQLAGMNVWYDDLTLDLGDSIRAQSDRGIALARTGIVVLSHGFFDRRWPEWELSGLVQRFNSAPQFRIIPIWFGVDHAYVARYSPSLSDLRAIQHAGNIGEDAAQVRRVVAALEQEPSEASSSYRRFRGLTFLDALEAAVAGLRHYLMDEFPDADFVVSLYMPIGLNIGADLQLVARSPGGAKILEVVPGPDRLAAFWRGVDPASVNPALLIDPEPFEEVHFEPHMQSSHYLYRDEGEPHLFGVLVFSWPQVVELDDEWKDTFSSSCAIFKTVVMALDAKARRYDA